MNKMSREDNESLSLYEYICQDVGTPSFVKLRRTLFNILDLVDTHQYFVKVSSGSTVEGLDFSKSDLDVMFIYKEVRVFETEHEAKNAADIDGTCTVVMDTKLTKSCFARLKIAKNTCSDFILCNSIDQDGNDMFFSSERLKALWLSIFPSFELKIHGPCISTCKDDLDMAFCFQCEKWISTAREWIFRPRTNWPSSELISKIVSFGVLFVPIGSKGSVNEGLEWRISFSVAEKLLIYSFSHTQFLCYALLKILLKEIIDQRNAFKGLLCSYFMKTLIFWMSEESKPGTWIPENMISCFMACLKRLIYCIEHSTLFHYFIPENNLFEDRFSTQEKSELVFFLCDLYKQGWSCLLLSQTFNDFYATLPVHEKYRSNARNCVACLYQIANKINENDTFSLLKKIKGYTGISRRVVASCYSEAFLLKARDNVITDCKGNKRQYSQYKQRLSQVLIGVSTEPTNQSNAFLYFVSAFFYRYKRYDVVLKLMQKIVVIKFDPRTLTYSERNMNEFKSFKAGNHVSVLHGLRSNNVFFRRDSFLIPDEMQLYALSATYVFYPTVFMYFLRFLCNYHLGKFRSCMDSLDGLERNAILKCGHDGQDLQTITSFNCLGIAYLMIGKNEKAQECFSTCLSINPEILNMEITIIA